MAAGAALLDGDWVAYVRTERMGKPGRNPASKGHAMAKNTICLWYDKDAEAAARFYAETFPDSAVGAVHHAPSDYPPPARKATC